MRLPLRSRTAAVLAGILLFGLAGHLFFVTWLAHAIVDAPNKGKALNPAKSSGSAELARWGVDRELGVEVGPPAASLSLWILEPRLAGEPRGTILVLHGIRDQKRTMLGMGQLLTANGFRAVLLDLRGHGDSAGQWLTYGITEARDLRQVADALERQGLLAGALGLYGPSYGGAVALQYAALDPRVRAVVTVATFASARQAVFDYIRRTAPPWLLPGVTIDQALRRASRLAGVSLADARPTDAIRATRAQCLLFHGTADRVLSPGQARELAAAGAGHARLMFLEGETHDTIFRDRSGILARETIAWFGRWLGEGKSESE